MEKIMPNKNSRRHSTGNFTLEPETYNVLSRYLKDPFPSCHDNCKPLGFDHSIKTKSTPPVSPKLDKTQINFVNSVKKTNKLFTQIPKPSTKDVKITNTSLLKHQIKPQPIEPKKQEFLKSKSKSKSKAEINTNDPFYIPPSTTLTRGFSEIMIPTTGLENVLDSPHVGGLTKSSKKIESRKDLNSKQTNFAKNTAKMSGNGKISKKVQTLKPENGLRKPRVDQGSRKSKPLNPVGEVVQEKTDKMDKTQSSIPTYDESVSENGQDSYETPQSDRQNNEDKILETGQDPRSDSENNEDKISETSQNRRISLPSKVKNTKKPTRVRNLVNENENRSSQKLKFNQGKIIDAASEISGPRKLDFSQGKAILGVNENEDDKISLKRLSSDCELRDPESESVNVVLKPCDVEANKSNSGLNHVIEETASKLIQTRKSKVKALVGAFEMISSNGI